MKIELKNIKVNSSFSEETICFTADVFINGKKAAYAQNDGRGGSTFYHSYTHQNDLVKQAEVFCKNLPKKCFEYGGQKVEYAQTLESFIDDLVCEKEAEKQNKKIEKLCESNIVYGNPKVGYSYVGLRGRTKLEDLKKTPNGREVLAVLISQVRDKMKSDEIIYNKNLEI